MKVSTFLARANSVLNHSDAINEGASAAAGALILANDTKRILIGQRGILGDYPMTWATIGGCFEKGEGPRQACRREIMEETGYTDYIKLYRLMVYTSPGFAYHNFLAVVPNEFVPVRCEENNKFQWCKLHEWPEPRHPGFDKLLSSSVSMTLVLRHVYGLP